MALGDRSFGPMAKAQRLLLKSLEISPEVNVSRMSPKLLRTQPHIVENRGITMAPLFLSLTS